jgi:hypothetical protein
MWRLVLVLVGALCACGLSEQAVPLAELDARARFSRGGAAILTLADEHFMDGPCSVLPPTTTATMNGIPAEIVSLGGIQNGRTNDWWRAWRGRCST